MLLTFDMHVWGLNLAREQHVEIELMWTQHRPLRYTTLDALVFV